MKTLFTFTICILLSCCLTIAQSCFPDGTTFSFQAEIDHFADNYPNCQEISGTVIIEGNNIVNLDGLENLTYIENLFIQE